MARNFKDLSEREILALAIALEEEDGRVYADFVDGLREAYPTTAKLFEAMEEEESQHRASLIALYQKRFGEHIPLVRRQDVKGFVERRPVWLMRPLGIATVRKQAEIITTRLTVRLLPAFLAAGLSAPAAVEAAEAFRCLPCPALISRLRWWVVYRIFPPACWAT